MKATLRPTAIAAALLLSLAATPVVHAQVTISVTATATTSGFGYTATNPYTFIFTTGATYANNPNSTFGPYNQDYREEDTTTDDQLWSSISGTGLGGAYVRPALNVEDPTSKLEAAIAGLTYFLQLFAVADSTVIGNTTKSGSAINGIYVIADKANLPSFAFPESHVNPSTYFAAYYGTYTGFSSADSSNADVINLDFNNHGNSMQFNITSITISGIPEPSTYGALLGVAALGLAEVRRRRSLVQRR